MKNSAYQALRRWHEAYSVGYRKLELAFNYLRNCHQVDFNKADHQSALHRQREQEAQRKVEAARKRVIDKVIADVNGEYLQTRPKKIEYGKHFLFRHGCQLRCKEMGLY